MESDLQRVLEEKQREIEALQRQLLGQQQQQQQQQLRQPQQPQQQTQQPQQSPRLASSPGSQGEPPALETSASDEVGLGDVRAHVAKVAKTLSKGHDVIENAILRFADGNLSADRRPGDSATSTLAPFNFRTSRADVPEIERITVEILLERLANSWRVSYRAQCRYVPSSLEGPQSPLHPSLSLPPPRMSPALAADGDKPVAVSGATAAAVAAIGGRPQASLATNGAPSTSQRHNAASAMHELPPTFPRASSSSGAARLLKEEVEAQEAVLRQKDEELQVFNHVIASGIATGSLDLSRRRCRLRPAALIPEASRLEEEVRSWQEEAVVCRGPLRDLKAVLQEREDKLAELQYKLGKAIPPKDGLSTLREGVDVSQSAAKLPTAGNTNGAPGGTWRSRARMLEEELKLKSELVMRLHQRELWFEQQLRRQVEVNGTPLQALATEVSAMRMAIGLAALPVSTLAPCLTSYGVPAFTAPALITPAISVPSLTALAVPGSPRQEHSSFASSANMDVRRQLVGELDASQQTIASIDHGFEQQQDRLDMQRMELHQQQRKLEFLQQQRREDEQFLQGLQLKQLEKAPTQPVVQPLSRQPAWSFRGEVASPRGAATSNLRLPYVAPVFGGTNPAVGTCGSQPPWQPATLGTAIPSHILNVADLSKPMLGGSFAAPASLAGSIASLQQSVASGKSLLTSGGPAVLS